MKVDHFAHRPPVTCQYGSGETQRQRECKTAIFEVLAKCENVKKLELDRHLKEVRPDVSCYIGDVPVAIEVKISALSYEAIDSCLLDVSLSEWHDENGDEVSAEGYTRYSKRYLTPAEGGPLGIARDFVKCDHILKYAERATSPKWVSGLWAAQCGIRVPLGRHHLAELH